VDFGWSGEQESLRQAAAEFARRELRRDADQDEGAFSPSAWTACAKFGVQGMPIPEQFGGQGADLVTTALVLESLGYGCTDNGLLFSLNAHLWSCAVPIWKFGTDEQRETYLPGLCDGSLIGVQAVTEAGSGSDAFAVATTAIRDGDSYLLNGSKIFITNAPVAGLLVVLAREGGRDTDRPEASAGRQGGRAGTASTGQAAPRESPGGPGTDALVAFIVEGGLPGITVSKPFDKLGLRSSPMAEVTFTDCRVPASAVLGGAGAGMTVFTTTIEFERSFILASALGTMRRQLEEATGYARSHRRFGQPIGKNQAVANRIVDMRVRLDAARLLLYRLAWLKDQGKRTTLDSAIVKLFLSEAFVESSTAAFETFGAQAYLTGSPQERDLRDALASRIYSGTSDIQRVLIGRLLGL
jgi:alkylation response protein AidB-like acyl-CoA dehydrogenase